MLPREERLTKKNSFEKVFKQKCSVSTSILIAYVIPKALSDTTDLPLTAFIAGKKVHKKAIHRNKAKRHIREAYRLIRKSNPELVIGFKTIIFIARPTVLEKEYTEIYQELIWCLKKAQKFVQSSHVKANSHLTHNNISENSVL